MANEISVLTEIPKLTALFLYPIAVPKIVGNQNVIVTPSSDLPTLAAALLTIPEKLSLDNGTSAFEVVQITRASQLSTPNLDIRLRSIYSQKKNTFGSNYSANFNRSGRRINEV